MRPGDASGLATESRPVHLPGKRKPVVAVRRKKGAEPKSLLDKTTDVCLCLHVLRSCSNFLPRGSVE